MDNSIAMTSLCYLTTLRTLLAENADRYLFPCIVDLVTNGLRLEQFGNDDRVPSRQDVTQYLVAWSRYAGLSADECKEWMIDYTTDMLSVISSSSKSQIRHSTKGNIKYIYSSEVAFACMCEHNKLKAACESTCPVYEEMTLEAEKAQMESAAERYEIKIPDKIEAEVEPINLSVKEKHKEQFEKAMVIAKNQWKKSIPNREIVNNLNASGFKTRTGKNWSTSTLCSELKKLREMPK